MDVDVCTNAKQYDRECVVVDESSEAWFQVALSVPVDLEQNYTHVTPEHFTNVFHMLYNLLVQHLLFDSRGLYICNISSIIIFTLIDYPIYLFVFL